MPPDPGLHESHGSAAGGIVTVYASYDVTLGSSPEALPRKRRSLASRFLLVAFAVMVIGMLALGTLVSWQIEKSVAEIKAASTALYVNTVLAPHLQEIAPDDALSDQTIDALQHALGRPDLQALVASVKVWNKDGLIVYSNQRDLIGEKPAPNTPLRMAWEGIISAKFDESYDDIARRFACDRPPAAPGSRPDPRFQQRQCHRRGGVS